MRSGTALTAGHGKDAALAPCTHAMEYFPCMRLPLMVAVCRLLRETFEPEQLTPSSTLEADPQGNRVLEVAFWICTVAGCLSWPFSAVLDCVMCLHLYSLPLPDGIRISCIIAHSAACALRQSVLLRQAGLSQVCLSRALGIPAACFAMQVGPRLSFQSAWSTNAVSICQSCGLDAIPRLEVSRRFLLHSSSALPTEDVVLFAAMVCRITSNMHMPKTCVCLCMPI